jgi:GNAT superfamily N-acetyltransferase
MFTEPDHRGRGLAARIVKEAIAWARKSGYPRLSLHASDMGKGVYHKLGFRATREMVLKL